MPKKNPLRELRRKHPELTWEILEQKTGIPAETLRGYLRPGRSVPIEARRTLFQTIGVSPTSWPEPARPPHRPPMPEAERRRRAREIVRRAKQGQTYETIAAELRVSKRAIADALRAA